MSWPSGIVNLVIYSWDKVLCAIGMEMLFSAGFNGLHVAWRDFFNNLCWRGMLSNLFMRL